MKGDQIRSRWKAPPYPDAAWASSDGAIVAVRFGEEGIKASEVAALGSDLAEAYKEAVPGLLWRSQELATAGASPVVISEFESDSSLGRIVNVVLSSSYDGRLFAITVTGAVAQADAVRELSAAIKDTLVIR
jgi:hypothetical protein